MPRTFRDFYPSQDSTDAGRSFRAFVPDELGVPGFKTALDHEQFSLLWQPVGCLRTGAVLGVEGLLRWTHPKLGLIEPEVFLRTAQRAGLMRRIDHLALKGALDFLDDPALAELRLPVSVNLSAEALTDSELHAALAHHLSTGTVAPHRLELEFSEAALAQDLTRSVIGLDTWRELGVRIVLDDFGAGRLTLEQLSRLPISVLKLSDRLLQERRESAAGAAALRQLVRLAHALNLEVVALGVQGPEEVRALRALHCDRLQGYGLAGPMPANRLRAFVEDINASALRIDAMSI